MAKALNRLMQRRGRVFADRYHAHQLRTVGEVRAALNYRARLGPHEGAEAFPLYTCRSVRPSAVEIQRPPRDDS